MATLKCMTHLSTWSNLNVPWLDCSLKSAGIPTRTCLDKLEGSKTADRRQDTKTGVGDVSSVALIHAIFTSLFVRSGRIQAYLTSFAAVFAASEISATFDFPVLQSVCQYQKGQQSKQRSAYIFVDRNDSPFATANASDSNPRASSDRDCRGIFLTCLLHLLLSD